MSNACFAGMLGPTFLMAYLDFQGELGIKYCFGYFGFCCKHLLYTFGFAVFVSCPYFCLIIPFREIILVVKKKEFTMRFDVIILPNVKFHTLVFTMPMKVLGHAYIHPVQQNETILSMFR